MSVCKYVCVCLRVRVCLCVCVCVHMYVQREKGGTREKERSRDRGRDRFFLLISVCLLRNRIHLQKRSLVRKCLSYVVVLCSVL